MRYPFCLASVGALVAILRPLPLGSFDAREEICRQLAMSALSGTLLANLPS